MQHFSRPYEDLPISEWPRVWAQIDLNALKKNYRLFTGKLLGQKTVPIAVVKADAYGHGMTTCARVLLEEGCCRFAVACLEEGLALRKFFCRLQRQAQILILGYTDPRAAKLLAEEDLIQTALSPEYTRALVCAANRCGVRVRVHYAVDTGMNRIGFSARREEERKQTVNDILHFSRENALRSEGLFTHFACADEEESDMTALQSARFASVRQALTASGLHLFCHLCNSAAVLKRPGDYLDGVRPGILLWGALPNSNLPFLPVMRLCTRVAHLHTVLPGDRIGYGGTFCARQKSVIATLPVGYADGWLRGYQGGKILIETQNGQFQAPLAGRICMDQCMADVTGIPVQIGDRVTLFGGAPGDLFALAQRAGTIAYESLCAVSSRVPRIYV